MDAAAGRRLHDRGGRCAGREGALHEGVVAGHGAAELEAGDVGGHDPGQLLDAGLPGGDAHLGRGGRRDELLVGADVEVVVEARGVVDAEGDRLAGRDGDVADLGASRIGELQGAGGHEVDDAGLAAGRDGLAGSGGPSRRSRRLGRHGRHGRCGGGLHDRGGRLAGRAGGGGLAGRLAGDSHGRERPLRAALAGAGSHHEEGHEGSQDQPHDRCVHGRDATSFAPARPPQEPPPARAAWRARDPDGWPRRPPPSCCSPRAWRGCAGRGRGRCAR